MDFTVLRRLNATILLVCVISVLIYLADSAPAPTEPNAAATTQTNQVSRQSVRKPLSKPWEEAREIWNGLRVAKKQNSAARERRDAPDPTQVSPQADYSDLNNLSIPIPTYMKELYWNLSRQESEDADTTTIRSMPGLETGNGCGFNFSVGDISEFEVFTRAELRIYMKTPAGSVIQPVFLQLYHGGHKGLYKKVNPSREGWIVFDVLSHLQRWRASNHPNKHIHFYVTTYNSIDDLSKEENGKDCNDGSSIQFEVTNKTNGDIDQQPMLMIYTHDLDVVKFNLSAIFAAAEAKGSTGVWRRQSGDNSEVRPTLSPSRGCGKHTLQIDLNTFNQIWRLAQPSQSAIYPMTFDINVCGGNCDRDLPSLYTAQHSIILYYLHTRSHTPPYSNAMWGQCCAPVKYRSIETLISLPNQEFKIVTLRDISVEKCSCMSILRTQPPTPSSR